jgi:cytoskeletal protein RodZ
MTELRGKIDVDIQKYTTDITPYSGTSTLRYILAGILIIGLLIWLIYTLSDDTGRKELTTKFNTAISTLKKHLQPGSKKRERSSDDTSDTTEDAGSFEEGSHEVDRTLPFTDDSETIRAALNEPKSSMAPTVHTEFQNDYSDSNIQAFNRKHEIGWSLSAEPITYGDYSTYSTT